MNDIKGDRLYVNLSASQTRQRLKRFGHGVRKVHSAGKNQAVIIHTATGRHLDELRAVFADASPSDTDRDLGEPIANLRNLGPTSARWLQEIGVNTRADLERLGPVLAFRLIKTSGVRPGLNLLWAMAAAIQDRDWRTLTDDEKHELRTAIEED